MTSDCVDGGDGVDSKDAAHYVHVSSPANVFDAVSQYREAPHPGASLF